LRVSRSAPPAFSKVGSPRLILMIAPARNKDRVCREVDLFYSPLPIGSSTQLFSSRWCSNLSDGPRCFFDRTFQRGDSLPSPDRFLHRFLPGPVLFCGGFKRCCSFSRLFFRFRDALSFSREKPLVPRGFFLRLSDSLFLDEARLRFLELSPFLLVSFYCAFGLIRLL